MRGVVILMALLSLAGGASAQERAPHMQGEMLVRTHCGQCHATGDSGRSPNRAAPPMRELHNRFSMDNLEMALSEGMLRGHPAMPKFDFTQGEIDAIMSYLRSIQTNQSAARGSGGRTRHVSSLRLEALGADPAGAGRGAWPGRT